MPAVQDFYSEEFQDAGILVLGIAISAPESDIQAFIDQAALTFPMTYDPYGELTTAYGVTGVPTCFFLDKAGRIADAIRGAPNDVEYIRTLVHGLTDE